MKALLAGLLLLASMTCAADEVWVDVRSSLEYSFGHIEQAVHIPHDEIGDRIADVTTDKSSTIYLYCMSGGRAEKAKKTLEAMGYTKVINLGGKGDAEEFLARQPTAD